MPFCAQILDAALFLPGVSAPVTADFSWDPQADAVPGAKAVPAGLRRRLSPLGKAAAEALFSLDAFRNETKAQTEDDAWVFSSRWGDLDASVAQLRSLAGGEDLSPTAFATSVHNGIAGQLSIAAKHTGFVTAITGSDAPFARGFETAAALLVDLPWILADDKKGVDYFVGTPSFSAILHYNRSYFYAAAVSMLADEIRSREIAIEKARRPAEEPAVQPSDAPKAVQS